MQLESQIESLSFPCNVTISEICAVSKVSKKDIGRVFKLILKTLETSVELITTGDFMVRHLSQRSTATYCKISSIIPLWLKKIISIATYCMYERFYGIVKTATLVIAVDIKLDVLLFRDISCS